ncbi:50S ribosomal protein L22 [Patescibacteria group bacterium]|nr:50S ribosomal protein L22 [Patescibacteria group bacterium]MBU1563861.1 50S ribosomal protein L22 [Patescibacteria group bacterium]
MITAKLRHLRISSRKVRLVVDLVRGLNVIEAEKQLKFLPKRAAEPVLKLLNSAVANALNNFKALKENLFIAKIMVDPGPTLKRWMPRAMGRATPLRKRTSHITIVLESKEPLPVKKEIEKKEVKPVKKEDLKKDKSDLLEEVTQPIDQPIEEKEEVKLKSPAPDKPYQTTSQSKKKFFSRQTFGNVQKRFRRKVI